MKKSIILIFFFVFSFFSVYSENTLTPFPPGSPSGWNSPFTGGHSFDSNLGFPNPDLKGMPDLGDDIEGGGGTGIGREIVVNDSTPFLFALSFLYLLASVLKRKKLHFREFR